jgi:hypothetical protein
MAKSVVYEVHPAPGAGWVVEMASDSQSESFDDKFSAVARARRLADRDDATVRVVTRAGHLESEYTPRGAGPRA